MKAFVALAFLLTAVCGAPSPAKENVPKSIVRRNGIYFVLSPVPQDQQHISPEQVEEIMSQLRQEDGSDSGLYHIVLPDGRLQRVEYTTAPVQQTSDKIVSVQEVQPSGPASLLAQTRQFPSAPEVEQQEQPSGPAALIAQRPRQFSQAQKTTQQVRIGPNDKLFLVGPQKAEESSQIGNLEEAKPAKFVASVQYTEVQPITGPIYSYDSQPLTRIVRYAPLYKK